MIPEKTTHMPRQVYPSPMDKLSRTEGVYVFWWAWVTEIFYANGDRAQFMEYIQKNVKIYQFRNGILLTTAAAANFTRGELVVVLHKNPYRVNILMVGYDKETRPSLYFIDYIATLHKVDKGAFGYGAYFSLTMMDIHYHSGMSVEEAIDLVDKCIVEIRSRLVVAPPNFVIKIIYKDGAREYARRETVKDALVVVA